MYVTSMVSLTNWAQCIKLSFYFEMQSLGQRKVNPLSPNSQSNTNFFQFIATIGDKSVEKIVENRTSPCKSVVRVKFQAPFSPIQC